MRHPGDPQHPKFKLVSVLYDSGYFLKATGMWQETPSAPATLVLGARWYGDPKKPLGFPRGCFMLIQDALVPAYLGALITGHPKGTDLDAVQDAITQFRARGLWA